MVEWGKIKKQKQKDDGEGVGLLTCAFYSATPQIRLAAAAAVLFVLL